MFTGQQPDFAWDSHRFWGWIVPAFLIAFSLDVGQIVTSAEIRAGKRNPAKYATFAVFSIATYYLQWLYIAHHMPALSLAEGVRSEWLGSVQLLRDLAIWFIPALLPASTLLYTFSTEEPEPTPQAARQIELTIVPSLPIAPEIPEYEGLTEQADESYLATCPHCEWQGVYATPYQAKQARNAHMRSHLPQKAFSTNGNH